MDAPPPDELDTKVRDLCERGELQAAASLVLSALGPDVLRLLYARFRDQERSAEVFSRFAEALWLALPKFEFRCTVRAFVFALAKHSGSRYLERELKRERRGVPLAEDHPLLAHVEGVRTRTAPHLRTEVKQRLSQLRQSLSHEDQLLLTLRVDRRLEFQEIALILLEDPAAPEELQKREAARLRKRLQLLKERLKRQLKEPD